MVLADDHTLVRAGIRSLLESVEGVEVVAESGDGREALELIAKGRTMQEIAGICEISIKTVETHRLRLMERLDIHDVPGLVRFAIRVGLVSPAE